MSTYQISLITFLLGAIIGLLFRISMKCSDIRYELEQHRQVRQELHDTYMKKVLLEEE